MDNCYLTVDIRTVDYRFLNPLGDEIIAARTCKSTDAVASKSDLVVNAARAVRVAATNGTRDPHFCCDICREKCECAVCKEGRKPCLPFQMFPSATDTEDEALTEQFTYTSATLSAVYHELRRIAGCMSSNDQRWSRLDNSAKFSESNIQDIVDEALTLGAPAVKEYLDVLHIPGEIRSAILVAVHTFLVLTITSFFLYFLFSLFTTCSSNSLFVLFFIFCFFSFFSLISLSFLLFLFRSSPS